MQRLQYQAAAKVWLGHIIIVFSGCFTRRTICTRTLPAQSLKRARNLEMVRFWTLFRWGIVSFCCDDEFIFKSHVHGIKPSSTFIFHKLTGRIPPKYYKIAGCFSVTSLLWLSLSEEALPRPFWFCRAHQEDWPSHAFCLGFRDPVKDRAGNFRKNQSLS